MADEKLFELSTIDDVSVIRLLDANLNSTANIQQIGDGLLELVEENAKILVDFSNVKFLSSAMLGKLVDLHKRVEAASGALKLCNIHGDLSVVFTMTKLDQLLDIQDSEADALATF